MAEKITSEIFQVGGSVYTSPEDAAIYLIKYGGHAALVDAGCGYAHDRLLRNIRECGVSLEQIEYLLITHCHFDHTGGVSLLKEQLGCAIVAHELEADYLEQGDNGVTAASWYGASIRPFTVDRKLSMAQEEIVLGERTIKAIHIPGHSPGSVVYLTESEGQKVLFAQDVHGPLAPSLLSDRKEYLHSLRLLISLEADILCEGHYGIYRGKKEVAKFIRSFL
jgi:glyoxylase-like metal-dependent hydrolase (beta-lactamase superfamily II)